MAKTESISVRLKEEIRKKIPETNYTDFLRTLIENYFIYRDQLEFLWDLFSSKGKPIPQSFKIMPTPEEIENIKEIKFQVELIKRGKRENV